ncbi:MAG TPA: nicotinate-nucleotide--dimethylbenzimidazole phosphoribosyltransferase [Xanthobacteraceae bacterium]|jgi:nicotinate-nucleotide--dimethylbenzimidazole phosphoribosyltransferase|nr:nicotinate-nucleotide--dimethylbenzimidazole phosphoribosyltransferase [Xanthobacteraceae bacterium]
MADFTSFSQLRAVCLDLPSGHPAASNAVAQREAILTKPPRSLGRLEDLVAWLAHWQGHAPPRLDKIEVLVFAGNHGVTARGVSAYPAEVTVQMVANFAHGGAAINQLARAGGAQLRVIPLSLNQPTADFTKAPAMSESEFIAAVKVGHDAVSPDSDLVCLGEMGIGNTTAAAAIAAALFGGGGERWAGRGTGVDDDGLSRKRAVIDVAMTLHARTLRDPLAVAATVGGRELAAIMGACLAARRHRIPVLLDGFVCTAAVAPLAKLRADTLSHAIAAHVSAEAGHRMLLDELHLDPLLDMNMRLGEASGAALAINILRAALACHTGMATFAEAGVSDKPADESAEPKAAG